MKRSLIALAAGALLSTAAAAQQQPPVKWTQQPGSQDRDDRDDTRHRRIDRDGDRYHDRYRNPRYDPAPAPRVGEANPFAPKVGAPNPYATQGGTPPRPLDEERPRRR